MATVEEVSKIEDTPSYHAHKEALEELERYLGFIIVAQRTLSTLQEPHITFSKMPFKGGEFGVVQARVGRLYRQTEEAYEVMSDFVSTERSKLERYEDAMKRSHPKRRLSDRNLSRQSENQGAE